MRSRSSIASFRGPSVFGMAGGPSVAAMPSMPAVHEQMEQWAQQQQHEWQHPEDVGGVLDCEEEGRDGEEAEHN